MLSRLRTYVRKFDRRLWVLSGSWLVNGLGYSMTLPFLTLYLAHERKVPMTWVGALFLIAGLGRTGGQLLGGRLADLLGRKRAIMLAQVMRVLSYLALGGCVAVGASLFAIGVFFVLNYMCGALFQCAADVLVADLTEGDHRVEAYGLMRVGLNLGWAAGPAIGAFLARTPFSLLFFLSAGVAAVGTTTVLLFVREAEEHPARESSPAWNMRGILKERPFLAFCAVYMILAVLMSQLVSTISIYTREVTGVTQTQLGWLYTINGLICIAMQMPVAACARRFRMTGALVAGSLVYAAGYLMLAWRAGFGGAVACIVVITMGEVIVNPPATALASLLSSKRNMGRNMGVFGLARGLGFALGPMLGGVLFQHFRGSPLVLWGAVAAVGAVAALGFLGLRARGVDAVGKAKRGEA